MKNSNNKEDPIVVFVHVPKTAGTSLKHIAQFQFKPQNVWELYQFKTDINRVIEKYHDFSPRKQKAIKFISGHVGFGIDKFLPRPCNYITILRDPVERVISYYYFLQRNKSSLITDKTLANFVKTYGGVHNSMTCYLSGLTFEAQLNGLSQELKTKQFERETLELAKQNLKQRFKVFGLLERFDETCLIMQKELGWQMPFYYDKKNVSKARNATSMISQRTLNSIKEVNQLDLELYDYAAELFEELVASQKTDLSKEIEELYLSRANYSDLQKFYCQANSYSKRIKYKIHEKLLA